jgi:hypothetical protein
MPGKAPDEEMHPTAQRNVGWRQTNELYSFMKSAMNAHIFNSFLLSNSLQVLRTQTQA